jgi:hypothetical protein
MATKRRRIMLAFAVAIMIWTLLVVLFVERFDVLVSDDPFDAGANLAQQSLTVGVFAIWLVVTLMLLGMLAAVWRVGRRG